MAGHADFNLDGLDRFYRLHAPIYDLSRPLFLRGRAAAVRALSLAPGQHVLDVGCGTGYNLPALVRAGARVVAIEPTAPMRVRAARRAARLPGAEVRFDPLPYGSRSDYAGWPDRVLFSYSLSMIPPFADVLARARADLRPLGRLVVVDFLDAPGPVAWWLRKSHVGPGPERLAALASLFPHHTLRIRSAGLWRYFLFAGDRDEGRTRPGPTAG